MSLPSPNQVNELIRTRRSIFVPQFEAGKVIPDDIVWQLLENANWAPTHKRSELWRFVVFSGAGLQKLADFQAELYKQTAGPRFNKGKYEKLRELPPRCSHVIALAMHPDPARNRRGRGHRLRRPKPGRFGARLRPRGSGAVEASPTPRRLRHFLAWDPPISY